MYNVQPHTFQPISNHGDEVGGEQNSLLCQKHALDEATGAKNVAAERRYLECSSSQVPERSARIWGLGGFGDHALRAGLAASAVPTHGLLAYSRSAVIVTSSAVTL
jgi:hypothetical protein